MVRRPFRKVLVANRGEVAVRVVHALREMGIASAAIYSAPDANALHVRLADEAHPIGPGPAPESYLRGEAIAALARRVGAEAVHPGYGFLAESAAFAEAVAGAGLTFIGPPPAAMRTMGDKAAARAAMRAAEVPCVPGSLAPPASLEAAAVAAREVGYPLMLKATAGGGGRGMRLVDGPEALPLAWATARKEALTAFGDGTLYLERALTAPRHIEVQIFAEADGEVVDLGERECSLQRRHQKVIEEAPAVHLPEGMRARLREVACRAARAVAYRGAGTVEFLVDAGAPGGAPGGFYFLEMNTRLQVEHPVTEMVHGVDLVEAQVLAAAGLPTPLAGGVGAARGHAIEARVSAEDPDAAFAPSPGTLRHLSWPRAPGVRVEAGVDSGCLVSPFYDPLLGKVVAWGRDRERARRRLQAALAATCVVGTRTNLRYLQRLLAAPAFVAGDYHTQTAAEVGSAPAGDAAAPLEARRVAVALAAVATYRQAKGAPAARENVPREGDGAAWRRGAAAGGG